MDRLFDSQHLILLNSAPASRDDYALLREQRLKSAAGDNERMKAISSTARYQEGDIETEAGYYRIHFGAALRQKEHLDRLI